MNEEIPNKLKPKILLLEDYPDLIEFYVERLKEAGFEVLVEDDEDRGIETAKKEKPDLIVLDISLPKSEDFAFISDLKKNVKTALIPVIILTDLSSEEDVRKGMEAGASEYLIREKFTFVEVIDKIKETLNHKP
jgi:DNA-binding response OmpR family regulator